MPSAAKSRRNLKPCKRPARAAASAGCGTELRAGAQLVGLPAEKSQGLTHSLLAPLALSLAFALRFPMGFQTQPQPCWRMWWRPGPRPCLYLELPRSQRSKAERQKTAQLCLLTGITPRCSLFRHTASEGACLRETERARFKLQRVSSARTVQRCLELIESFGTAEGSVGSR